MDSGEAIYVVESSSKIQVSPRNRDRRFSSSTANDHHNNSHISTQHIVNSPDIVERRGSYDLGSTRAGSPSRNTSKWIQEDLDAEEEAIKFLHTQTKLVERLKKELREQNVEIERLKGRLGKQDQERAEVAALYDELRELEQRYRRREEEQARKEGESAAHQEHFEALRNEQKALLQSLEKDLDMSEQRNVVLEQELRQTRELLSSAESRNAANSSQFRQQIAQLESQCEKYNLELESVNARYESCKPTFEEETKRLREALDDARRDADDKLYELSKLEAKNALLMQNRTELEVRAQQGLARAREARVEADARRNEVLALEEEVRRGQEALAHIQVELDTALHREKISKASNEQRERRLQEETVRWSDKCSELENDLLRCWQEVKRAQEEEIEARRVQDALTAKRLEALQRRHAAEERLRDALVEVVTDVSPNRVPNSPPRSISFEEIIKDARMSPNKQNLQRITVQIAAGGSSPDGSPARSTARAAFHAPATVRMAMANLVKKQQLLDQQERAQGHDNQLNGGGMGSKLSRDEYLQTLKEKDNVLNVSQQQQNSHSNQMRLLQQGPYDRNGDVLLAHSSSRTNGSVSIQNQNISGRSTGGEILVVRHSLSGTAPSFRGDQ